MDKIGKLSDNRKITEKEKAFLIKSIDLCNQNKITCINCECLNLIKKHFFKTLNNKTFERVCQSHSDRHFRCICFMLSNLNRVLSKNELTKNVWANKAVGPNSLPVLIYEIRNLIDCNYEIINSRRKGYALIRRIYQHTKNIDTPELESTFGNASDRLS
ncbi:winged helix-turn-helix domain-containing protein [Aeromonas enteropelogenes]|uniref:winged helix-turn-helix domain-containing protein n=1 Tax=Aeromonas enteropelogenes TaxID=29489 RepID=UPI003BA1D774